MTVIGWKPVEAYNPNTSLVALNAQSNPMNSIATTLSGLGDLGIQYADRAPKTLDFYSKLAEQNQKQEKAIEQAIGNEWFAKNSEYVQSLLSKAASGTPEAISGVYEEIAKNPDPSITRGIRNRLASIVLDYGNTMLGNRKILTNIDLDKARQALINAQTGLTKTQARGAEAQIGLTNSQKEGIDINNEGGRQRNVQTALALDPAIAWDNLYKQQGFSKAVAKLFNENPYISPDELRTQLAKDYPDVTKIPLPTWMQGIPGLRAGAMSYQGNTDMQLLQQRLEQLKENSDWRRQVLSRINTEGIPSEYFISPERLNAADPGQRLGFFSTPQGQEIARQKGIDPAKGNMLFDKAGGGMYRVVNRTIEALRNIPELAKLANSDVARAITQLAVVRAFSNENSFWDWALNEEGTSVDTKFDEKDVIPIAKKMLLRFNEIEKPLQNLFGNRGALTYAGLQPIITNVYTNYMQGKGMPLDLLEPAIQQHVQAFYNSPAGQYLNTPELRAQYEQAVRESFTTGPRSPFYPVTPPESRAAGANAILNNPDILLNPSNQEGIDRLKEFRNVDQHFDSQISLKEAELALPETQTDPKKVEKLQKEIAALKKERQKLDPYRESVETNFDREREGQTDSRLYKDTITEVIQDPSKYDRYFPILQRGYNTNQVKVKNTRQLPSTFLINPEMELSPDAVSIQDPGAKTSVNFKNFYTEKHSELKETIKRIESHKTTGLADYEKIRLPQLKKELQTLERMMTALGIKIEAN